VDERNEGGGPDERPHVWAPPEPPSSDRGWAGWDAGAGAPDGPPPPPWERDRRNRRRTVWIVVAVLLLIGIPVGLAIAGAMSRDATPRTDEPTATVPPVPEGDDPGARGPDRDTELEPPDPAQFDGVDADFAALLGRVEDSERAMLRFQRDLEGVFFGAPADLQVLFAQLSEVAADGAASLADAREELEEELATPAAEDVRVVYLDHLDAWLAFMEAVADDPALLGPDGDSSRYDVAINQTAADFADALEELLPDDADPEVRRFAQDLLDRGFRFDADAQV